MELTLFNLIFLGVSAIGLLFLGVLLGRRSKTANAYTDRILAESQELREKLAAANAKIKAGK